ncbi:hypothetical protein ABEB36_009939 [Hypothenemus hampei]|uniref:MoaB/Mog domain-containing protein n=1 Tax=Hypothenemus hampei TaxID=57062 RepID=A0ABD1EHZ7_HYPHA
MSTKWLRHFLKGNIRNIHTNIKNTSKNEMPTASILVIGDEILKGDVPDTNSSFLAKELHRLGLKLKKISVIADDVTEITEEVKIFSNQYDYVITTGGIGPTHDDVTYEGVALAFDVPLYLHPELKAICTKFYCTKDPKDAGMKLAFIPQSSKLNFQTVSGGRLSYPNVSIENVYMFPGIPELLKKTFLEVGPLLFRSPKRFYSKHFFCKLPEHEIVAELQKVVDEFPDVQFGSYPKMYHNIYKVKVTIESCCEETTLQAYSRLMELMPTSAVVNIDDI